MSEHRVTHGRDRISGANARPSMVVPPCRCAGGCRCAGLVPALLLREIERECEFFRSVL